MKFKSSIPRHWKWVRIGDICKIIGGKPAPQESTSFCNYGIPFVRMKDLGAYHLTTNLTKVTNYLSNNYVKQKRIKTIKKGSILLPRSGSVALNHRAILGMDAVIVSHICALEVDSPEVFNEYLYHLLTQIGMEKITKKTTGLDAITFEDLGNLQIPLPPLAEQKRIAAILDKADAIRRKRQQAIKLADDFLRATFLDIFGDPITNPKGWPTVSLIEIVIKKRPITYGILKPGPNIPDGIPYIRVVDMKDGIILTNQIKRTSQTIAKQYRRSTLKGNDLLLSIRGHVGRLAIVPLELYGANITQDTARITPNNEICNTHYLFSCLNTRSFQNEMQRFVKGAAVKGINLSDVKELKIPLPPLKLQEKVASIQISINKLILKQEYNANGIEALFNSLTQRAFRGEL